VSLATKLFGKKNLIKIKLKYYKKDIGLIFAGAYVIVCE
jgi:hypothetical protein